MSLIRSAWSVVVMMVAASLATADERLQASFDRDVKPFLKQYCERCHHADKQTSGVRVDHLDARLEDRHLKLWEHVLNQTKSGAMPPDDAKQPSAADRKRVVQWAEEALKVARLRPVPKNGSVRRLTAAQYRNTLRELLLLEDNVAEALPPDAVSRDGFVNNQETLQISPLLLEAYFDIADQALSRSIVDPKSKPVIQNFRVDLGAGINPKPIPDNLILGADSLLIDKRDFTVEQLKPQKPFPYDSFEMRTKYRFIEGYRGNDTVRGWREFDSIYHSVFACMRGNHGYPKGRAYSTVPGGLLLRPAIPSSEIFGQESTYGPKANFKIALRELPDQGRFRVTVMAAKYDDGLLLDPGTKPIESAENLVHRDGKAVTIREAGIYQVDVHPKAGKPTELTLKLGERSFVGTPTPPAFLAVRLPAGELPVSTSGMPVERLVFTRLADDHDVAKKFVVFEKRSPQLGVSMGFRRDCGSTLAPVGEPQPVRDTKLARFTFEGAIQNFPDPNVEKDNVNYLAGIREIGVRSEFTDGRDMPRLVIRSVEFEGPLYDAWPPASHHNIFASDEPAAARVVIRDFATKAFRRPITADEEAAFVAVFEKSSKAGARYHDAVKDALQVVLTSPQFLFLIEASRTPEPEPLDHFELATKLAYFLWNGPPDATLLRLAASGELPKRLDSEVARMIADPRFGRFASEFTTQWLALDKFAVLEPDRKRFPKMTRDARRELGLEPIRFFEHLVRNNLPARNLITSDFVIANEVVANYYGLADRTENGHRFVPIAHGRRELGGLLTQPAILAGLSDGREPNPVKRGAWLARRIVAEPPDDPPPNVPALQEDNKSLSLRQRLERHRNQPGCAQCHSKIDPWGVPFEEFDAGGLFRSGKIDSRSTLPDKTEVADFAGLRKYLADDRIDQVAFSLLKHLTIYATGRNLTYGELELLRTDALRLKANGYRTQEMIRYVVGSKMFLEK